MDWLQPTHGTCSAGASPLIQFGKKPAQQASLLFFRPIHPLPNSTRYAGLWRGAGLEAVETREIVVERTFSTFEEYWATSTITGGVRPPLEAMPPEEREKLKKRVRARVTANSWVE